jgi:hypothetical protein
MAKVLQDAYLSDKDFFLVFTKYIRKYDFLKIPFNQFLQNVKSIKYRLDKRTKQIVQLPNVLLYQSRSGDCKSLTILLACWCYTNDYSNITFCFSGRKDVEHISLEIDNKSFDLTNWLVNGTFALPRNYTIFQKISVNMSKKQFLTRVVVLGNIQKRIGKTNVNAAFKETNGNYRRLSGTGNEQVVNTFSYNQVKRPKNS